MADRVWISWNDQRRNIGLAAAVNAALYMTDRRSKRLWRLLNEFCKTWKIIKRDKPSICFTMNPSIFSSWWLSILAALYGFRLVTDLHTPNIESKGFKKKIFQLFFNSGIRNSDIVITTNDIYRRSIMPLNSNVVVVPDPLPALHVPQKDDKNKYPPKDNKMQVLFICSFDPDEPINEVLELDSKLDDFDILVSGDWKKKFTSLPTTSNIHFLGFIGNDEYDRLLLSVDGIMVLTKREGCLCCGAYEAFAVGKPLILSKTSAQQEFFGKAPIYTINSPTDILSALKKLKAEKKERAKVILRERNMLNIKFRKGIEDLENAIQELNER